MNKQESQLGDRRMSSSGILKQRMEDTSPTYAFQTTESAVAQQSLGTSQKIASIFRKIWLKSGLDTATLRMMLKGSLPPAIGIAMYQAKSVQEKYGTLGYLIAISSLLGFAIMPRGKFVKSMLLNVMAICLAAAVNLLALFCAVQARIHTTPPGPPASTPTYNASASAVCGIWLIFQIYLINVGRAARPQLQFPAVLCSIFVNLSMTNGVLFPSMSHGISFMKQLLETFLTGFGLATVVNFAIFPVTSRKMVWKEIPGYLTLISGSLSASTAYVDNSNNEIKAQAAEMSRDKKQHSELQEQTDVPGFRKLRDMQRKLVNLHSKLDDDVTLATREFAIGKLKPCHIIEIWQRMRQVFLPVTGLASILDVLKYQATEKNSADGGEVDGQVAQNYSLLHELQKPMRFRAATMDQAFQHILLTLELVDHTKVKESDEERFHESIRPGTPGFVEAYKRKLDTDYLFSEQKTVAAWCMQYGINLPHKPSDSPSTSSQDITSKHEHLLHQNQMHVYLILYIEYLLWRTGTAVLDLLVYVDKIKQDRILETSKVVLPYSKGFSSWVRSMWAHENLSEEDSYTTDVDSGSAQALWIFQKSSEKRDPEHFPPRNRIQKFGNMIRLIPKYFRSEQSQFGLRVAAATMTIGILCYLRDTQNFFLQQRLRWAMNSVALSMNRTAGQSTFCFILRVVGTAFATVGSYVIWYMVDGKTPGVIVLLWLWMFLAFYVVLKVPRLTLTSTISMVTILVVVGYELQVQTIGVQLSEQSGQPAYPTYELAPYRLAAVASGLLIAFIWTIFPYPVSESSELRKDISASLSLLSLSYSITHETVTSRLLDTAGDEHMHGTHAFNLASARAIVLSKLIRLLSSLQKNTEFSKFQIHVGGDFPRHEYNELIGCIRRLILFMTLTSYTSSSFQTSRSSDSESSTWFLEFRQLVSNAKTSSKRASALLSVLSFSLSNAQPVPADLHAPESPYVVKLPDHGGMDDWDSMRTPEVCASVVIQVLSQRITSDVECMVKIIKKLVGEMDVSFDKLRFESNSFGEDLLEK